MLIILVLTEKKFHTFLLVMEVVGTNGSIWKVEKNKLKNI